MTKAILVFVGIILAIVLIEIALAISNYQKVDIQNLDAIKNNTTLFHTDTRRIYKIAPNVGELNGKINELWASDRYGFRYNPVHTKIEESIDDGVTVIVVGDSSTYGHDVPHKDSYPAILEKILGDGGTKAIVHNAGVPGYGPDQEFVYIKEILIPQFHPDIVIWNINSNNDIWDSNDKCLFRESKGRLKRYPAWLNTMFLRGLLVEKAPRMVLEKSLTVNLVYKFLSNAAGRTSYTAGCTLPTGGDPSLATQEFLKKITLYLSELNRMAQKEGIRIVVTLVPVQAYFDKNVGLEDSYLSNYFASRKLIFGQNILAVDVNQEIARVLEPALLPLRQGVEYQAHYPQTGNVLGDSSHNLADELFLLEDSFRYGNRHTNEKGNEEFAYVVAKFLLKQ